MKNDIFNFRRFGKYFTSDLRGCWANYGLSLMTISFIIPVISYVIFTALNLILSSEWDGPDMGFRVFAFCIAMFCIVITMPVKCYGKITEKRYGSFWLTLPASRLEKFVSMFLMTCIIVPITGIILYLGMDALICAFDHTCGNSLVSGGLELIRKLGNLQELTMNLIDEQITIEGAAATQEILNQISSPWIYIDDFFGITLPFLLGAIFFKSGKTVKTILAMCAISTAISIAFTPLISGWAESIVNAGEGDPNMFLQIISENFFKHLVLIDTVSDTIVNGALLAGIWFRIKTLKH